MDSEFLQVDRFADLLRGVWIEINVFPVELPLPVILVVQVAESGLYVREKFGCLTTGDWLSKERLR